MTGTSPYAAPDAAPYAAPAVARTTTAVLPLTIALGASALIAAVVNQVFGSMFPSNAPVEQIYNFGITVDLVAVAIVCLIRVLVLFRLPRGASNGRLSVFGIIAAVLAIILLAGWLAFGGAEYWIGGMARYMSGSAGAFYLGVPWVLALVFGEISVRRSDSGINSVLPIGSLVIGAVVGVSSVAAAVIYGLGLSY
jgi:hypothetical protein